MPKRMHCQEELERDLDEMDSFECIETWFNDRYSTSAHLWVLYSIPVGLNAKKIGEIGVGRSSVALCFAARVLGAKIMLCDRYNYRGLLPVSDNVYLLGDADKFFSHPDTKGMDFLFMDYMSTRKKSVESCYKDMKKAIKLMRTNGIIAIHDAFSKKYNVADALEKIKDKYGKKVEVLTLPYCSGLGLIRVKMKSPYGEIKDTWKKKKDSSSPR